MGVLFALILVASASANPVDSLLARVQSDTAKPLEYRIDLLKKALRAGRDRADVCAALGALLMKKNTPAARLRADRYIYRAIVLDPENIEYRLLYATLQRKKGFRYNAMNGFKKVLALDSTQVQAACEVGDYYLQDMLKYVDARRFDGGGSMRSFAMESVQTAAHYYRYARSRDPYCKTRVLRVGDAEYRRRVCRRFDNDSARTISPMAEGSRRAFVFGVGVLRDRKVRRGGHGI